MSSTVPRPVRPESHPLDPAARLAGLEKEVERQKQRFQSALAIARAIGSSLDLDVLLRVVMDEITRLLDAERSTLYLVDWQQQAVWSKVLQVGVGLIEVRQPLSQSIPGWVCAHGETVNVPVVARDPRFNPQVDRVTGTTTRSMLVVPLRDRGGGVIGAIQVINRRGGQGNPPTTAFTEEDVITLEAVGAQAGIALENTRLFQELRDRNSDLSTAQERAAGAHAELNLLYENELTISGADGLKEALERLLGRAIELWHADSGAVLLLGDEGGELLYMLSGGAPGLQSVRVSLGEGLASNVARSGQPLWISNAPKHRAWDARMARRTGLEGNEALVVPLRLGDRTLGALKLIRSRAGTPFEEADARRAELIAGQFARAVELGRDRSERDRKSRLESLGQMMAGVLHDLRTPMSVISGYAQLMVSEEDEEERARAADIIQRQFDHIGEMTRETLAFARGEQELLLRKVYLHKFLDEIRGYLKSALSGKGISLRFRVAYAGVVRMDEVKIKRAVFNIARNAAQAMPDGGCFTVSVSSAKGHVVLRFSDTGTGISDEIASRLFQPFASSGKKDGTGLGLAIARKVVEEHGGDISWKSKAGQGTTFTLRIPLGEEAA